MNGYYDQFGRQFGPPFGQGPGGQFGPPFGQGPGGQSGPPFGQGPGGQFGPPFGQGPGSQGGGYGPPSGPPPAFTPSQAQAQMQSQGLGVYAVDPGAIRPCTFRYVYIWLNNGRSFWAWLVFVGPQSAAGWRWMRNRWVYFGIDLDRIAYFICY